MIMITIKDIAKATNVSDSTVSIVLNGKAKERKISMHTQQKVIDAAQTLGYRPNLSARRLRQELPCKPAIALYWSSDVSLIRVMQGLKIASNEIDIDYDLIIRNYIPRQLKEEKELAIPNLYAGIIVLNATDDDIAYLESLPFTPPIVLCNRLSKRYATVFIDSKKAGEQIATVFKKNHHSNVAIMLTENKEQHIPKKIQSFLEYAETKGIVIQKEHIFRSERSIQGGISSAKALLNCPNPPKAILCSNDYIALGVCYYFQQMQIKIPEDYEILALSIGNSELLRYSYPPISTMDIPWEEIAAKSLHFLIESFQIGSYSPKHIAIDTPFYERISCPIDKILSPRSDIENPNT